MARRTARPACHNGPGGWRLLGLYRDGAGLRQFDWCEFVESVIRPRGVQSRRGSGSGDVSREDSAETIAVLSVMVEN